MIETTTTTATILDTTMNRNDNSRTLLQTMSNNDNVSSLYSKNLAIFSAKELKIKAS